MALEYFNATDQPRKVASLIRSLGEPSVAVLPGTEAGNVEVTVAWELSWYRWEVRPDGKVRQLARGDELEELSPEQRDWNATASEDGRLRLVSA